MGLAYEATPEVARAHVLTPRFDPIALVGLPTYALPLKGARYDNSRSHLDWCQPVYRQLSTVRARAHRRCDRRSALARR